MSEKPSKDVDVKADVIMCGSVALLLYRSPIKFPEADVKYLKDRGILAMESPNLGADFRVLDMHTAQFVVPQDLVSQAAIASIGYQKSVFADKLVELVQKSKSAK